MQTAIVKKMKSFAAASAIISIIAACDSPTDPGTFEVRTIGNLFSVQAGVYQRGVAVPGRIMNNTKGPIFLAFCRARIERLTGSEWTEVFMQVCDMAELVPPTRIASGKSLDFFAWWGEVNGSGSLPPFAVAGGVYRIVPYLMAEAGHFSEGDFVKLSDELSASNSFSFAF